jgi:hypothetical protein
MFNYRAVNRTGDQSHFRFTLPPDISISSRLLCALLLLRLPQIPVRRQGGATAVFAMELIRVD